MTAAPRLSPVPPRPRRLLIIRLSALGDVVFATTLLHGLRKAFPDAEIDWLVQPEFAGLLRTQPAINTVLSWDRREWSRLFRQLRWISLWRAVRAFRRALRARDYDWVIDGQGLLKARLLAWLAGGRYRVGPESKEPGGALMQALLQREADDPRMGREHRGYLRQLLGVDGETPRLQRPAGAPAAPVAAGTLALVPFTTRPQKHWPEAHWVELIGRLHRAGHPLMLLGGPADRAAADRILAALPAGIAVDDRVGRTGIAEAVQCIADSRAVIGMDTGLTHIAVACDRPTVAIFGSTLPYRSGGRAPLAVEWLGLPCSPCKRRPTCGGAYPCLVELGPARIEATLNRLLAEPPAAGSAGAAAERARPPDGDDRPAAP
ncbi:MAG TPA: glycosyltransferase family 9 protein [Nevskiaceae bacterium]|nr:glycosyltransferase family 9 protein [Nevskiaceae bacterium]